MVVGGMHTVKNRKSILAKSQHDWANYAKQSKGKKFFFGKIDTVRCSQCERGMRKSLADKQIEFKRENAPICIPCIEGKPRVEIEKNIRRGEEMKRIKSELRNGIRRNTKKQNLKEIEELFNR